MEITEDERRTLLAEADLLDRVADLATAPGRLARRDLDALLCTAELPLPARRGRRRPCRVPRPRTPSEA